MPENSTPAAGATPEPETAINPGATPESQAGATPENLADNPQGAPKSAEELQAELDAVKAQLSSVNRESAERRKKLATLEADQQKRKDAELSEIEREKKRADDAEARANAQADQLRQHAILDATRAAAHKAGVAIHDAALADAYAAGAFAGIETDENGVVQGADAHFKELLKSRPYLLQQAASAPQTHATSGGKNDELISDAEYAETARRYGLPAKR